MLTVHCSGRDLELFEDHDFSVGITGEELIDAVKPIAEELAIGPVAVSWEPGNRTRYDLLLSFRDHYTTQPARSDTASVRTHGTFNPDTPWVGYPTDEPLLVVAQTNGQPWCHAFRMHDRFLDVGYVATKIGRPRDFSTAAVIANLVLIIGALFTTDAEPEAITG